MDTKDPSRCVTTWCSRATRGHGGQEQEKDTHGVVPDRWEGTWGTAQCLVGGCASFLITHQTTLVGFFWFCFCFLELTHTEVSFAQYSGI